MKPAYPIIFGPLRARTQTMPALPADLTEPLLSIANKIALTPAGLKPPLYRNCSPPADQRRPGPSSGRYPWQAGTFLEVVICEKRLRIAVTQIAVAVLHSARRYCVGAVRPIEEWSRRSGSIPVVDIGDERPTRGTVPSAHSAQSRCVPTGEILLQRCHGLSPQPARSE